MQTVSQNFQLGHYCVASPSVSLYLLCMDQLVTQVTTESNRHWLTVCTVFTEVFSCEGLFWVKLAKSY